MVNHKNYINNPESNKFKESRMTLSEQSESKSQDNWYVYIAQAKTGRFYTGISNNVEKRIIAHNQLKGSKFAKDQGKLALVYKSKAFKNKSLARKREIQLKVWRREKKIKLINNIYE